MNTEDFDISAWQDVINKIFPTEIPNHFEWATLNDIRDVLNSIGLIKESNHTFYPFVGGFDLNGCKTSSRKGYLNLIEALPTKYTPSQSQTVKPRRLLFEDISKDLHWSYFLLEQDIKEFTKSNQKSNGSYLICPKFSYYNDIPSTYTEGKHDKMDANNFRIYIEELRKNYKK
jgi:hypothetical protein